MAGRGGNETPWHFTSTPPSTATEQHCELGDHAFAFVVEAQNSPAGGVWRNGATGGEGRMPDGTRYEIVLGEGGYELEAATETGRASYCAQIRRRLLRGPEEALLCSAEPAIAGLVLLRSQMTTSAPQIE